LIDSPPFTRAGRAAPEEREFGIDAYDPTPLHRVGLAVHKNERLGMVCGENFPNILEDRRHTLFHELYRRHGPWRGVKTDAFSPIAVRYLRFQGTFSNGEPLRVRNVHALPAK